MSTSTAPHHSIVVAIDGSPASDRALAWACDEAQRLHRPLHILHAVASISSGSGVFTQISPISTEQFDAELRQPLDEADVKAHELAPSLDVTSELHAPGAGKAVVEASRRAHTVVMGARGHAAVTSALLGSVSTQVTMHAQLSRRRREGRPGTGPAARRRRGRRRRRD